MSPEQMNPMGDMDFEGGEDGDDETDPVKSVQKLTGKLAYKIKNLYETQQQVEDDLVKYIMNSIISSIDFQKVQPEVKDEFIDKITNPENQEQNQQPNMGQQPEQPPMEQMQPPPQQPQQPMESFLHRLLTQLNEVECEGDDCDDEKTKKDKERILLLDKSKKSKNNKLSERN